MGSTQSLFFIRLGDITPGACLQGIGLFIILFNTNFDNLNENINNIVIRLSKASYGIYLCNILVINVLEKLHLINLNGFTLLNIVIYAILVLILSALCIFIMSKVPILKIFSSINDSNDDGLKVFLAKLIGNRI